MLISEPVFAAAYRSEGSDARVFDDIGCLLEAVRREPRRESIRFWFRDAANAGSARTADADGGWIDGGTAIFVTSATLRTPMSGGIVAYREEATAARGAAGHQGRVIGRLDALLASSTEGGGR